MIEFLGLLLCNVEGMRCIGLSRGRQSEMLELLDEWLACQRMWMTTKVYADQPYFKTRERVIAIDC